jgi:ABC-2 type transport system ATP-binding protein
VTKRFEPPPWWLRPVLRVASSEPVCALSDVTFRVDPGEVVGLVGPNGAGKTTLLKIITGLLRPSEGSVILDGFDATDQPRLAARHLGLVLEGDRGIYDRLTGRQNLEFFGVMVGLSPTEARRRTGELLEMLDLADRDKLTFGYSAGMRMRLSLGRALLVDPRIVVLDEPTRSLDPVASRFVVRLVRDLASEGRAVLLSNHRLDEVVDSCSRVLALIGGRLRFVGDPAELPAAAGRTAGALADFLEQEDRTT